MGNDATLFRIQIFLGGGYRKSESRAATVWKTKTTPHFFATVKPATFPTDATLFRDQKFTRSPYRRHTFSGSGNPERPPFLPTPHFLVCVESNTPPPKRRHTFSPGGSCAGLPYCAISHPDILTCAIPHTDILSCGRFRTLSVSA